MKKNALEIHLIIIKALGILLNLIFFIDLFLSMSHPSLIAKSPYSLGLLLLYGFLIHYALTGTVRSESSRKIAKFTIFLHIPSVLAGYTVYLLSAVCM